jgi:hypothetical protein
MASEALVRKPFALLVLLLFALPLFCSVPISGNLKDISTGAITTGTFVRFELTKCGANVPRVTGTATIVSKVKDFRPSTTGAISGTLYANDEIECGGVTDNSCYDMSVYFNNTRQGTPVPVKVYAPGFNISSFSPSAECGTAPATPPATPQGYIYQNPVGDQNVSQPAGTRLGVTSLFATNLAGIVFVNGTNDAAIQAAIDAAPDGGTVFIPSGTYSLCNNLPITISKSVRFEGAGDSSLLQVCSTASSTTDIFLVKPASIWMGFIDCTASKMSGATRMYTGLPSCRAARMGSPLEMSRMFPGRNRSMTRFSFSTFMS